MELCALYSISRKTAYKWIELYEQAGGGEEAAGGRAEDRSHAAHRVHNRTDTQIEEERPGSCLHTGDRHDTV
jgi:transposase-like protein